MTNRKLPAFIDGYGIVRAYSGLLSRPDTVQQAAVRIHPFSEHKEKVLKDIEAAFDACEIKSGATLSFQGRAQKTEKIAR